MDILNLNYASVLYIHVPKAYKWQVLLRRTMAHRYRRNGKPVLLVYLVDVTLTTKVY